MPFHWWAFTIMNAAESMLWKYLLLKQYSLHNVNFSPSNTSCCVFKNVAKYGENGFTHTYKEQLLLFSDISYKRWLSQCVLSLRITFSRSFWTLLVLPDKNDLKWYFSGRETVFLISVFLASPSYSSWELLVTLWMTSSLTSIPFVR